MRPLSMLKKIAVGAISAGTTLLISACYGPAHPYGRRTPMRVVDPQGIGVRNIRVCYTAGDMEECQIARYGGIISLPSNAMLDKAKVSGLTVCGTDIDGPDNGTYLKTCQHFDPPRIPFLHITLRMDRPGRSNPNP